MYFFQGFKYSSKLNSLAFCSSTSITFRNKKNIYFTNEQSYNVQMNNLVLNEFTDDARLIIILQLQAVAYDNTFFDLFFQDWRFKAYSTSTCYCTALCKACTWQRRAYNPPVTRLSCLTPCSARNIRGMHASIFITQLECLAQSRQHESTFFVCLF